MTACIRAHQLCLDVPIYLQREREAQGWTDMFLGAAFDPPRRGMARLLDHVGFEVREGDRLAIMGRNGAGKSTLLRVLNGVYQPTSGQLEVRGSCQALLNMSLGFSPDATVRENIFLRGVAMGLRAPFLRGQVASILEFAGLEHKAGHRLRTLSSGQKMRLGFAISTTVQHDIILMDEWVGAGDADFMARAKERMQSRVSGSKIVVLASHSIGLLRDICNRGIVLEGGRLVHAGDIASSLRFYHEMMARLRADRSLVIEAAQPQDDGSGEGMRVFGVIEEIRAEGAGRYVLKGWMVDEHGGLPDGLAIESGGHRFAAAPLERMRRPDVMRHFGLVSDACGFRAVVEVPCALFPSGLGPDLRVLGGADSGFAGGQLRLGPAVLEALGRS